MAMLGNSDIYEIFLAKYGFFCLSLWYCSKSRIVTFFFPLRLQIQSMYIINWSLQWLSPCDYKILINCRCLLMGNLPKKHLSIHQERNYHKKKNPYEFYLYYVWILKTGKVVSDLSVTYKLLTIGEYFLWVLKVDKSDAYCTFFFESILNSRIEEIKARDDLV